MMSGGGSDGDDIYSFPSKPFIQTISDDDDDLEVENDIFQSNIFKNDKKKRNKKPMKYKQQKKIKPIELNESSEDEIIPIVIHSDDEVDTIEAQAKEKAESILKQRMNSIKPDSNDVVMNLVMSSDSEIQNLLSLLAKLKANKSMPIVEDITDENVESKSLYPLSLPIVRRASERIAPKDPLIELQALASPTPLKTAPALVNPIKLNTRLNGKHQGNWKMSKNDPFLKV